MSLLRGIIALSVVYLLSVFCSSIVAFGALIYYLLNPTRFRYLKPRPNQPEVLKRGYKHGFLNLHNGSIRLHYVESGDRRRPLLLLVHGFPEFWYSWRHQIREFQDDYHVVAIDMRGYGESSKPQSVSAYSVPILIEDIRQTISALGRNKCFLVAHDWGGIIAWRFALTYPEQVEKLIVLNCPHPKAAQKLPLGAKLKMARKTWYMFFFQCPYLPETLLRANDFQLLTIMIKAPPAGCTNPNAFTDEDAEAWKYTFQQPGALSPPIHYYRALIGRLQPEEPKSPKAPSDLVRPPTLIVWSSEDVVLGTELAHSSLQFCENGTLRVLEGVSHWSQFDRPDLCNQVIRDFLRK